VLHYSVINLICALNAGQWYGYRYWFAAVNLLLLLAVLLAFVGLISGLSRLLSLRAQKPCW